MRRILVLGLLLLTAGLPGTSNASGSDRAYLLAAPGGNMYWSVDPNEAEAPLADAIGCGLAMQATPTSEHASCLTYFDTENLTNSPRPQRFGATLWAMQMSRINAQSSWDASDPLRFRFEVSTTPSMPMSVHLVLSGGPQYLESPPATEVAPGVYEGTLPDPGLVKPSTYTMLAVRVYTFNMYQEIRLRTAGASWVEFPNLDASSVSDLRRSQPAGAGINLNLGSRAFVLNDDAYAVHEFSGSAMTGGSHPLTVAREGAVAIGWVESWRDAPLVDPVRTATEGHPFWGMTIALRDGHGIVADGTEQYLAGAHDGFSIIDLPTGDYTLDIGSNEPLQDTGYRAFLLVLENPRTLARMRWQFHQFLGTRTPIAASCEYGSQMVPVRPEVATWRADLSWVDATHHRRDWAPNFSLPGVGDAPCAENGNAPWIRFVPTESEIAFLGAALTHDDVELSLADTNFQYDVSFTYLP